MFLSPLMLAGLAAVASPIIIHLLSRRQHRRVRWAAMRFLTASVEKTKRRLNVEDLLLLLLRCLAVVILALAFARPALSGSTGGWFGEPPITGVIILDRSMSMAHSDGTNTRFDHARIAADKLLEHAPPGSSFALLLAGDDVDAVIPQPTLDLNLVRQTIKKSEVSDRGTRLQLALRRGVDLLQSKAAARREIHVFTDGQQSGLAPVMAMQQIAQSAESASIGVRLVIVGNADRENVAVTDLRLDGGLFVAHRPARFSAEVTNTGASPARNIRVALRLNDSPPSDEQTLVVLAPGERQRVSLSAAPGDAGHHAITVSISPDHLSADDSRSIALRAVETVSVLIVDFSPTTDARESASFFLRHAFAPVPREKQSDYFVKTTTISPAALNDARLDDHQAVVLCNVPDFTPALVERLTTFVRRGGGLIVFPGPAVNVSSYNNELFTKAGLLPASLGEPQGDLEQRDKPMTLAGDGFDHEIARIWNDPNSGSPGSVRVFRAFELQPDDAQRPGDVGPPRVVLRFATSAVNGNLSGKPMLIERAVGQGRVLLFATPADTSWTDLAVRPAVLVPLLQRTLGAIVASDDSAMNVPVGRPFMRQTGGDLLGREAGIVRPERGAKQTTDTASVDVVAVQVRDGRPTFRYDATHRAGAYVARFTGQPPLEWTFAAQADPIESNLATMSDADLDVLKPALKAVRWDPAGESADALAASGATEIWNIFATLAVALFASEILLANWFSRSK